MEPTTFLETYVKPYVEPYIEPYRDHEAWMAEASHHTSQFFQQAGPVELGAVACFFIVVGLMFMRGSPIR